MRLRPYPQYKPSGIDWLGHIPKHWNVRRGRYCMRVNPRSERLRAASPDAEVSFVPMEAVGELGGLNLDATLPVAEAGAYTEFEDGDVILAKITQCFENGKGAIAAALLHGELLVQPSSTSYVSCQTWSVDFSSIPESFRYLSEIGRSSDAGGCWPEARSCNFYQGSRHPIASVMRTTRNCRLAGYSYKQDR